MVRTRRLFLENLLALYGVQVATLMIPLLTLPYLARTLGPVVWGQVAAVQALSLTLSLVVEYGFVYSATRRVALHRHEPEALGRLAASVLGAKLLLSLGVMALGVLVFQVTPVFRESPALLSWGIAYAVAQGFSPLWYFQGIERLQRVASVDVIARVAVAAATFLLVTSPEHGWRVLALQGTLVAAAQGINLRTVYREIPFRWPTLGLSLAGLRDGASMFLFRGAASLYTTANAALLRLFVPSTGVAYYTNAERLSTAGKSMLQPVSQLLFPRMSYLIHHDPFQARRLLRHSLGLLVLFACSVSVLAILVAPRFVPWFFGSAYRPTVELFQLLCLTFPVVAASNVLGVQWMIPQGMDRAFNTIVLGAGLLNVGLMFALVPRFGVHGLVYSVIASESFVALSMWLYLTWRKDPIVSLRAASIGGTRAIITQAFRQKR